MCVWWLVWQWYSGLLGWFSWLPLSWYRTLVCPWLYLWVSFVYFIPVGVVRLHYRHTVQMRFVSDESTESTTAHPRTAGDLSGNNLGLYVENHEMFMVGRTDSWRTGRLMFGTELWR